jgi:hypothetical protein
MTHTEARELRKARYTEQQVPQAIDILCDICLYLLKLKERI